MIYVLFIILFLLLVVHSISFIFIASPSAQTVTPSLMASPLVEFPVILLFIFQLHAFATTITAHRGSASKPAMVLPVFVSHPNSTKTTSNPSHRLLQGSKTNARPNARMRLYDDLLLEGYYSTRLWIGTPPQEFALIVDTGSTLTYVPCSTCVECGKHQDPKFQPDLSSTYQPLKCNTNCTCDNEKKLCIYETLYSELSSSSGVLAKDIISFGNQSELVPQRAVFGCENVETGNLYSQRADGIIGLGRSDLSIVDQLVKKNVISNSFSLCFGGMNIGSGTMVLGGISPPSGMVFAESDPTRSPYYNIDLKAIHVAGKQLPLDPTIFDKRLGTVLDSGTTYAYLPEAAFVAFKDAVMKELKSLKQIPGPDPNYNDICFSGAGSDISQLSHTFPAVDLVFGTGEKLSLSPENYLFPAEVMPRGVSLCGVACAIVGQWSLNNELAHVKVHGAYCLGVFSNAGDQTTFLGAIVVRNTFVMYDRENSKMGFWKTNCSELWKRLDITGASSLFPSLYVPVAPSPLPSASNVTDLNGSPALAPSPSSSAHYVLPGMFSFPGILILYILLEIST